MDHPSSPSSSSTPIPTSTQPEDDLSNPYSPSDFEPSTATTSPVFPHPTTNLPPLFWTRHGRSISVTSIPTLPHSSHPDPPTLNPAPITLEDHTVPTHPTTNLCWARSVSVDDHVIVAGSPTSSGKASAGAYVVWHCTVQTLHGGDLKLRKRYSEFDRLRMDLVKAFPHAEAMIPALPRKSFVSRFRKEFLRERGVGLAHFLICILLNPEFAASPIVREFIFA